VLDDFVAYTTGSKLKQAGDFTFVSKVLKKVHSQRVDSCVSTSKFARLLKHCSHAITRLQVIVKDTNIMVANRAIDCVTAITNGLRQAFAPYSKLLLPALLGKLKEKKPSVITSLHEVCFKYQAALSVSLSSCLCLSLTGELITDWFV
jgi:hypothetical protein